MHCPFPFHPRLPGRGHRGLRFSAEISPKRHYAPAPLLFRELPCSRHSPEPPSAALPASPLLGWGRAAPSYIPLKDTEKPVCPSRRQAGQQGPYPALRLDARALGPGCSHHSPSQEFAINTLQFAIRPRNSGMQVSTAGSTPQRRRVLMIP